MRTLWWKGTMGSLVPVDNEEGRQGLALLHVVERVAGLGNLRVVDDAAPKEDVLGDVLLVGGELGVPGGVVDVGDVAGGRRNPPPPGQRRKSPRYPRS